MPKPIITILLMTICCCTSMSELEKRRDILTGNWLIISPEHNLSTASQYELYSKMQDSIIGLMGLKLVRLGESGVFEQLDSTGKTGRWGMTPDNIVFIENGGKGFNDFGARFIDFRNDMLHVRQVIDVDGERIELTWNLKKITGEYSKKLFGRDRNNWRRIATRPESETEIRNRLSAMLQYYSDYYKLVTRESSFFITGRVLLPFRFYQHAMSMKEFDEQSTFSALFYNKEQAEQSWKFLKYVMIRLRDDYPSEKDFLLEYAEYMRRMAQEIVKP